MYRIDGCLLQLANLDGSREAGNARVWSGTVFESRVRRPDGRQNISLCTESLHKWRRQQGVTADGGVSQGSIKFQHAPLKMS